MTTDAGPCWKCGHPKTDHVLGVCPPEPAFDYFGKEITRPREAARKPDTGE